MRRLLMVVLGLGIVAASAFVIASILSDSDESRPDPVVMPYPRTLKPLPVPEVRIGQGPWQDPPPSEPLELPKLADERKCDVVVVPDSKGQGSTFQMCKTG